MRKLLARSERAKTKNGVGRQRPSWMSCRAPVKTPFHQSTTRASDGRRRLASGTRTGGGRSRGPLELEAAPAGAPAGGARDARAAGGASSAASSISDAISSEHGDAHRPIVMASSAQAGCHCRIEGCT
eukprot:scaffold2583_cov140-Isochrysis_galbana.AAC.7